MNYTNLNEENNTATLVGKVCEEAKLSHEIEGEKFYEFKMQVDRLSKASDTIPVTVSERTLLGEEIKVGQTLKIVGQYRSYNKVFDEKSKLILHLFAKEITPVMEICEDVNEVKLSGFICKQPVYRKTPFGREICDILLAVNRPNCHKSDYIPCILWGRNARFVSQQSIGSKIEISGRIQSREYTKTLPDGQTTIKTAYEVSTQTVSLVLQKMPQKNDEKSAVNS